ncbi:protein of unknown function （Bacteriophage Mu, GpM, tail tube 5-112&|uniref:phage tail tube protein n=1 Tax=Magnetospirillum sp. XM-1 TaxID=1663591 RepID=UPI00073DF77A|nr:phage tail tube protein [Magnetospirillum sp. XM-1]CUW41142.1 protein of unknown function \
MAALRTEADVIVGGQQIDVDRKSVKTKEGHVKRDRKTPRHFSEEEQASTISFKMSAIKGISRKTVAAWVGQTVQVRWNNGDVEQFTNACTDEIGDTDGGFIEVKMSADPATEAL